MRGPVSGVLPDRGGVTGSRPAERSGSSGRSSRRRPRGSRNRCQQVGRGSSGTLRRLGETRVYTPWCAVDSSERCRTDSPDSLHDMGKLVRMHFRGRGEISVRSGGVDRTHHVAVLSVSSTGRGGEPVGVRVTTGRGRGWNRSSSSGGIGPPPIFHPASRVSNRKPVPIQWSVVRSGDAEDCHPRHRRFNAGGCIAGHA